MTLYGKAIIDRETLHLRSPYLPFGETAFALIGLELLYALALIISIFFKQDGPGKYISILAFSFLLLTRFPNMYEKFLKRSYSSRIPLSKIRDYKVEDDHHGIQTEITLYLENGRYKKIIFRKLENQYEAFIEAFSAHSSQ